MRRAGYGENFLGVTGWHKRWQARPDRRVLLFAPKDYAGSFFRWAVAINDYTDWAARLVVLKRHPYDYPNDLVFSSAEAFGPSLTALLSGATIIHLKDENGFIDGSNALPIDYFSHFRKPMIFTHYGGYARRLCDRTEYRRFVRSFAARVAMTPDLLFPWFDGVYIPHAIDTRSVQCSWSPGHVLSHSPSTPSRKGTEELVRAVARLDDLSIAFDLIQGVSHSECMVRKRQATLFFDQAGRESIESLGVDTVVGWYGNSALEAAVYGIPTIAHLSETALEAADRTGHDVSARCAIINTPLGVDGIADTIRWFFELSIEEQARLSKDTCRWIDDFHSYRAVSAELDRLYISIAG
jgi:hypothetical protein